MKRLFTAFIAIGLFSFVAHDASAQQWKSLFRDMLARDPLIQAAKLESDAAGQEEINGYLGYLPDIDFAFDYGWIGGKNENSPVDGGKFVNYKSDGTSPGTSNSGDAAKPNQLSWGVEGSLNLFKGMRDLAASNRASDTSSIASWGYRSAVVDSLEAGINAYINYWYLKQRRDRAADSVRLSGEKLQGVAAAVSSRQKTSFDQWQAEIGSQQNRENLVLLEGELLRAQAEFTRQFSARLPSSVGRLPLPTKAIPSSKNKFLADARVQNPSLAVAALQSDIARSVMLNSIGGVSPTVAFDFSYSDRINSSYNSGHVKEYYFGFGVDWRVSGLYKGILPLLANVKRLDAANFREVDSRRRFESTVNAAWDYYASSAQRMALVEASVSSNERIVEAQKRLQQGRSADKLSLIEVQLRFNQLMDSALNAGLANDRAVLDVLKAGYYLTPRSMGL